MSSVFVRLSVFWENQQLDVSLPAQRPVVDFIDEIIKLFQPTDEGLEKPGEAVTEAFMWALSSPTYGHLNPNISLTESGVIDGQRLYLTHTTDTAQAPFVDDILSEVRTIIADNQWRWSSTVRSAGMYWCALALLGLLFLVALPLVVTAAQPWTTPAWIGVAIIGVVSLTGVLVAAQKPHDWLRWAGLPVSVGAIAITWPLLAHLPTATRFVWTLVAFCVGCAVTSVLAGRKKAQRAEIAGATAFIIVALILTGVGVALSFQVRLLAVAAWGAWAPVLMLLIAPTIALNATGLPTMLRRNDTGDPVERTRIHNTALRSEALSRGIVWAATALSLLIIITLSGSPYWQQGIPAVLLALILMLRSHGFADARMITPLLIAGSVGVGISAAALVYFRQHRWDSQLITVPWWQDNPTTAWISWAVFAGIVFASALIFISCNKLTLDELQEARVSKIISAIDALICLAFIPMILVAQGVYTYFWAIM
ncbi:MAG: type VII secretion integral membrane protein EccD [Corynebacterium sp.]|nr:type VII secretion integral membrane protein EccD [Corynebacterium sp.]